MGSFSLPSAGGVVSLLNDCESSLECEPSIDVSAPERTRGFDTASQLISSPDSLFKNSEHQSTSSSPPTSVEPSLDSKQASWSSSNNAEKIQLPRIEFPEEVNGHSAGLKGRKMLQGDHVKGSPTMHVRAGEPLPPSATGVFPPGQWDRSVAYYAPVSSAHDHRRRLSSGSEDGGSAYNLSRGYPRSATGHDSDMHSQGGMTNGGPPTARKGGKEGSSGAITIGGKKRYPCQHPGCDKTFSTSGHAARHNRIHTGQKPYRCTFPGCKARFSRQDNSLQHYRTHILHPKGRSSQTAQARDVPGHPEVDHMELDGLDAEAEAKAELGRRALEDGTAIAVVHEVKDQHGRKKGETIERMVGMPRGRRESIRSNMFEDNRSTSPSSVDGSRLERQNSLPGLGHADPSHYDGASDFWSSEVARHHRLSLPHPHPSGDSRYRELAHQIPPHQREAGYPATGASPWSGPPAPYSDPRIGLQSLRSTVSPGKRDSADSGPRFFPGPLEIDGRSESSKARTGSLSMHAMSRPDDRANSFSRYDPEMSESHRRSISMGSVSRERGLPLQAAASSHARLSGPTASSALTSLMPSTRPSQSPKSSPTSSHHSAPPDASLSPLSPLDKLGQGSSASANGGGPLGLPPSISSLTSRACLAGASSTVSYQHPYSSDRSTKFESSATRDTSPANSVARSDASLPPLSAAPTLASIGKIVIQPLSSSMRTGFAQENITLPTLNSSAPASRRW